jgi:phage terminase large subunit
MAAFALHEAEEYGRNVVTSPYMPRSHSLRFHSRAERFSVMVFHRRAGKTVACINDLIDKAIQCPLDMPQYSYIAPLYKQAKAVAWNYLKFYAEPILAARPMESELSVKLQNGALIRLYGADNPDALRGIYNDGAVLDEYGNMSPRLFGEVIAPTLADRKGWCAFIGTPAGPNHFKELWDQAVNDPRWYTMMLKSSESGILDQEELEMLAHLPGSDEDTFAQEFECDFHAAVRGAYFGKLINKLEQRGGFTGHFPYDPSRAVFTAWDIGFSDDTSIWFFQVDGKTIRVIDFYTVSGYSVEDVLGVLADRPYAYGTAFLPHDAKNKSFQTGKSTRELMIAGGLKTVLVPNLSVQDGIQAVRATLPTMQMNTHNPEVLVGLNALRIYQREWDDKKRIFKQTPLHDWSSNPADAMRMLALAMNPAAAKRAARTIKTHKPETPVSNVYSLEKLWAEREARNSQPRRI